MDVHILDQRQRVRCLDGWEDYVQQLGIFSSQEAAIRWLRKSRRAWEDTEPLMPVAHPGGCTLAGGRYTVTARTVDPEPITREQWLRDWVGAIAGTDGELFIPIPPQAEQEHE